jgi:hypothetical protein
MDIEQKITELEKEVKSLKDKKKDGWDIFQIVAGLLIPASIAFAGYYYASSMKEAEIASAQELGRAQLKLNEEQTNKQVDISKINARVGQANTVSSLLNALLSTEPQRRKLAIRLVLIALPEDGPDLVKIVSESDQDPNVQNYAKSSIEERRLFLVQQLFQNTPSQRISAADELISGWRADPKVVELLLQYARQNMQNSNGVFNTLVVLNGFDLEALRPYRSELESFSHEAEAKGEKSKEWAEKLRGKLNQLG